MTAEVLGVEYTMVKTNPMEGDTRTPEFLAINPQHNIPAILDGMEKLKVILTELPSCNGSSQG